MKVILCFLICCTFFISHSQRFEYRYRNNADSTFNCYLKIFPNSDTIKGLVVRDYSTLPDVSKKSPYQFTDLCSEAGLMTLYTNTSSIFPELFIADSAMILLDQMIHEVIAEHNIPAENIFIGGISASGTRALRFAQYCSSGKSSIKIKGVFSVDSPLDLERFYLSILNHKQNFKHGMLWEAEIMHPYFLNVFGGGPDKFYHDYLKGSVFTHSDSIGGNAHLLAKTDIILFHEPDLDWWLEERGCSYYDINSFDIAAFTVLLRQLGNENITLVTSTGKGYDQNGKRNCHSWTIVNEQSLIDWIVRRLD